MLVWPLRSGSVVQASEPTTWASTNMKSQPVSVSRVTLKASDPPPVGTANVCMSRLYEPSAAAPEDM